MKERIRQSRFVYTLLWYYFRLRHPSIVADSATYWGQTRNLHAGRRGFVIGNGPSLKTADLTRLRQDVCIASNKIYLAFDETPWRPNYLTCCDKLVWPKIQADLPRWFQEVIGINTLDQSLATVRSLVVRHLGGHECSRDGFSLDLRAGAYGGRTVTYTNLQLAAHLGLNPIYLLGCDHYYQGEAKADVHGEHVEHSGTSNHFSPHYRTAGEKVNSAPIAEMNAAFRVARRVAEKHGIRVLNATRGGHLEEFERTDFDAVVPAS